MIIIPINMLMMIISIHNISHLMILMAHGLRKKKTQTVTPGCAGRQRQAAAPGSPRRSASARMGERPGMDQAMRDRGGMA